MGNSRLPADGLVCPRRPGVWSSSPPPAFISCWCTELQKSTDLFLADKVNVLRTMLRERPDDWDALREEIELESAARRYQQFYIRLLDERNSPLLTTPGMAEQLDLAAIDCSNPRPPERAQKNEREEMVDRFS